MPHRLPPTDRQRRSIVEAAAYLATRTAETANRRLLELLRPGYTVLDVGCANGSITRSIAAALAPDGYAIGLDSNVGLILEAAGRYADVPNLEFQPGDAYAVPYENHFDIVTAARTVQWLRRPAEAVAQFKKAVKPGGTVLILDYNHEKNQWAPELPPSVRKFWAAYLRWRKDEAFDPTIGDRLAMLRQDAGFENIVVTPQHERFLRGEPDFDSHMNLLRIVLDKRGD